MFHGIEYILKILLKFNYNVEYAFYVYPCFKATPAVSGQIIASIPIFYQYWARSA
jgi:hypothetical protein